MKKGIILYHSNIQKIYKPRWIKASILSILNQTINDVIFYEVNYDSNLYSVLHDYDVKKYFWSISLNNYAEAMNFILDRAFEDGCDIVFNTNLDDIYSNNRLELQSKIMANYDYDIVSSDFCYIQENQNDADEIIRYMNIKNYDPFIKENLLINHNVIAHPSVCYSKNFWLNNRYDTNKTPEEDLDLWKKAIVNGYKFKIIPEILLYYRIHKNQVSNKNEH